MIRLTRTTPPASAERLRASAASLRAEIPQLESEDRDLSAALVNLVGDPQYAEVAARRREIGALLPSKREELRLIEAEIPNADKRERTEKLKAERAAKDRETEKRCRTLPARYTAAAEAYADVLKEIQQDDDEWRQLNYRLRDLGLPQCHPAEHRLRTEFGGTVAQITGTASLTTHTFVPAWNGSTLFRGRYHTWPNK